MKTLLTTREVSEKLSIGISTVHAYHYKGLLKPVILPHTTESKATKRNWNAKRFELSEVERFWHSIGGSGSLSGGA